MNVFFGLEVSTQHLQIVYYTGIIIGMIVMVYLMTNWKEKKLKHWLISYSLVAFSLFDRSVELCSDSFANQGILPRKPCGAANPN